MASLFVIQGRDQGSRFQLEESVHSIGRTHSHSIRLHDTEVSRNHAELVRRGDAYLVRDLGSSNGTFVNGRLVAEQPLVTGDQVQVGRSTLLYTGFNEERLEDLAGKVDIVPRQGVDDGSRIVASLSQTGGSEWLMPDARGASHPWLSRARSNLQIMYRTALAVSHTMDIDQLLARIMEMIFDWVDADRGCIMLKVLETGRLTPKVRRHRRGVLVGLALGPVIRDTSRPSVRLVASALAGALPVFGTGAMVALSLWLSSSDYAPVAKIMIATYLPLAVGEAFVTVAVAGFLARVQPEALRPVGP